MFYEIMFAILFGIFAGIFTGLLPGIHVNLITVIAISLTPKLPFEPILIITSLLAMGVTHTFVDSIPSILLGAPDESNIIMALPGHTLFLRGDALQAIYLTVKGGLVSLVLSMLSVPIILLFITLFSEIIADWTGWMILVLVIFLLLETKKIMSLFMFLFSGILGIIVFDMWWVSQPLLPLLSGLFGVSLLLVSLSAKQQKVKQHKIITDVGCVKSSLIAVIGGFLASFLPGLGSSQMAVLMMRFLEDKTEQTLLLFSGGINTVSMALSLCTYFLLSKARNGLVVGISDIFSEWTISFFLYALCVVFTAGCICASIVIPLSKLCMNIMEHIPYQFIVYCVISLIVSLVYYFDSVSGIAILLVSTLLGIWCDKENVAKQFLLGCLLLPVIGYFLL